jgi:hypothetical protein
MSLQREHVLTVYPPIIHFLPTQALDAKSEATPSLASSSIEADDYINTTPIDIRTLVAGIRKELINDMDTPLKKRKVLQQLMT